MGRPHCLNAFCSFSLFSRNRCSKYKKAYQWNVPNFGSCTPDYKKIKSAAAAAALEANTYEIQDSKIYSMQNVITAKMKKIQTTFELFSLRPYLITFSLYLMWDYDRDIRTMI